MAYTAPSTVSTLQTYTSAAHNIIVNDIIDHESRINTVQNAQYALKNLLINGAMQFAQRGSSVTGISSSGYHAADRWRTYATSAGTHTLSVSADAPTGSGYRNSLRVTCSATAASGAVTYFAIGQSLEGQTLQMIRKGTSSAQQLTLQFWVKSSRTGTYVCELYDNDNTRQVSASYTINSADTWEYKTITFPADATGVLDNDNAASLIVSFIIAAGTNFTSGSLNTTWNSVTVANTAAGQTGRIGTAVNDYFAVTGVQLEVGSVASPYEFLQYDEELRRCLRYYYRKSSPGSGDVPYFVGLIIGAGSLRGPFTLPVLMRTVPTIGYSNLSHFTLYDGTANNTSNLISIPANSSNEQIVYLLTTTATNTLTNGRSGLLYSNNASAYMEFSAEL